MKKRTMWAVIALTLMTTTALTGCSSDSDHQETTPVTDPVLSLTTMKLTRAEQEMVNQSNEFAFNLFRMATMEGEIPSCFENEPCFAPPTECNPLTDQHHIRPRYAQQWSRWRDTGAD